MFSKDTLKIYDFLFRFTTFVKCVPFGWANNYSVLKLYPLSRYLYRHLAYLNWAFDLSCSLVTFYGLSCYVRDRLADSSGIVKLVPSLLYMGGIVFSCSLQLMSYLHKKELAILVNKIFQTSKLIERNFNLKPEEDGSLDRILFFASAALMIATSTVPFLSFVYESLPSSGENLYAYWIGPELEGRLLYCVLSSILIANKFAILNFMTLILFCGSFLIERWLKIMVKESKSSTTQFSTPAFLEMYSSLGVMRAIYLDAYGPTILTSYLVLCFLVLTTGSATIVLFNAKISVFIMSIIADLTVIVAFALVFGLYLQSSCTRYSHDLLGVLRHKCRTKPLRARLNSLQAITYKFGDFFVSKPGTVLTVLGLISQNTISLILLYEQ